MVAADRPDPAPASSQISDDAEAAREMARVLVTALQAAERERDLAASSRGDGLELARAAHDKLQYDFPIVTPASSTRSPADRVRSRRAPDHRPARDAAVEGASRRPSPADHPEDSTAARGTLPMRVPASVRGGDGSCPAPPPRPLRRRRRRALARYRPRVGAGTTTETRTRATSSTIAPPGRRTATRTRTVVRDPLGDARGLGLGLGLGTARGRRVLASRAGRVRVVDGASRIASSSRRRAREDVHRRSRGFQTGGSSRSRVVRVFRRRGRRESIPDGSVVLGEMSSTEPSSSASASAWDASRLTTTATAMTESSRARVARPNLTRASRHPSASPSRTLGGRGTSRAWRFRRARALRARIRRDARPGPDGFRRRRRRDPRARDARVPVRASGGRRARRRARER